MVHLNLIFFYKKKILLLIKKKPKILNYINKIKIDLVQKKFADLTCVFHHDIIIFGGINLVQSWRYHNNNI